MTTSTKDTRATVIPALRYRDPASAVAWLCEVFGFERHLVAEDSDGGIEHAQLSLGNGMIMLGPVRDTPFGAYMTEPAALSGKETQTPYLIVSDIEAIYARAKQAGAVVLLELKEEDYGGRTFTCRDPEGHIWTAGTYDPW